MNKLAFPVIAVPARDEEKRLPRLLSALADQSYAARHRLSVVIVLNNCTDGSWAAASAAASLHPQLSVQVIDVDFPAAAAHVGSARRLAMETALTLCPDPAHGVLLTTDADAMPDPDWVDANLRHIAEGADLVGGVIVGDRGEEAQLGPGFRRRAEAHSAYSRLADQLAAVLDPIAHDPWPRHHDHTGASIALRAEVYAAVGGLPVLPRREDLALVSKVREAGYRLRHPLDVRVNVSARLVGRATGGMADCLKEWMREETAGLPLLVEDPRTLAERLDRRRQLRALDTASTTERNAIAQALAMDPGSFWDSDGTPFPAARLIERLAADDPDAAATVAVEPAIASLQAMIADVEGNERAA